MSCMTSIGCVMLSGVMTWLEGSSVVRNLREVGLVPRITRLITNISFSKFVVYSIVYKGRITKTKSLQSNGTGV